MTEKTQEFHVGVAVIYVWQCMFHHVCVCVCVCVVYLYYYRLMEHMWLR